MSGVTRSGRSTPRSSGRGGWAVALAAAVIVEDSGASRPPAGADTHLDMWIGGQDGTLSATNACEDTLTGRVPAVLNPPANLPVIVGPIYGGQRCNLP